MLCTEVLVEPAVQVAVIGQADAVRELDAGLRLRLIRPDDEPRLIALHERLSAQTAYQRFFTVMRRLPTNWASRCSRASC